MDLELQGKRVLVTGGSKGIGLAVAQRFLAEGAKVIIVSRSEKNLEDARQRLKVGDDQLRTLIADLRDANQAQQVVDAAAEQWGELDILVNSAGDAKRGPPEELDSAAWHAALDAKYFTYIHTQDAVLARWRKSETRGSIVNVVGTGGGVANPSHAA